MTSLSIFTKSSQENSDSKFKLSFRFEDKFLNASRKKNVSKPYQFFGIWIAQNLNDFDNLPLYIKLAKEQDRSLLEHAVSYLKDYPNARSKPRLFLWYLKGKLKKKEAPVKVKKLKEVELALFKLPIKKTAKEIRYEKLRITNELIKSNLVEDTRLVFKNDIEKLLHYLHQDEIFKKSFEVDKYIGIYKVDIYSMKLNIAIDISDDSVQLKLNQKLHIKNKINHFNQSKVIYIVVNKSSIEENIGNVIEIVKRNLT
jgi:hypothetical protein